LQGSSVLDAALWLRRWALGSTTFLLQGVAYRPPTLQSHCLSCVCLLIVGHWDQLLAPPLFSGALSVFHQPSLLLC
jgi:hypothetical protein